MPDKSTGMETDKTLVDTLNRLVEQFRLLDSDTSLAVDRELKALIGRATRGMSPIGILTSYVDWLGHLAVSPGKLGTLLESLARKCLQLGIFNIKAILGGSELSSEPAADRRMQSEEWQEWPFSALAKGYELAREWVGELTSGVEGVSARHEKLVAFLSLQIVELLSPANFPLTNPEVLAATKRERGANLVRGAQNLIDDATRKTNDAPALGTENYRPGEHVAITPGKVVYENRLIELIQYSPVQAEVGAEPLLIVPAWIMKYYILDLSPRNSLVKYLVDQGKTVFAISWKNPTGEDRDLGMDDYLRLGVLSALDAVNVIADSEKVHAVGYCLGGTLLTIAAALMAREGDDRLKSMTTLAAQMDFREAGEIQVLLDESVFSILRPLMWKQGYLGIENMVGAFTSLRAGNQIFGPAVNRYLLGNESFLNDLMAWNADGTRMPYRMHTEYLRNCYLENNLAECRYMIDGRPICVADIRVPSFILGTVTDHVAPWQSVYKAHQLMNNEITFLLTSGGHNAGIVSGPTHPRRRYQMAIRAPGDRYTDPHTWQAQTETTEGSWWPAWNDWLDRQMSGQREAPTMGAADNGYPIVRDAPGKYVVG